MKSNPFSSPNRPRFVRKNGVLNEWFPASPATLYRRIREGKFPAPVRIGPGVSAWLVKDLEHWAASLGGRAKNG